MDQNGEVPTSKPQNSKLVCFPFEQTPAAVRTLFGAPDIPEASWDWFATLARSTLADGEHANVAALASPDGEFVSAIPVVFRQDQVVRNLTSPYTTIFRAPLGSSCHAALLGKQLGRQIRDRFSLDSLSTDDPLAHCFVAGLAKGGLVTARYTHFSNWFEQIPDFTSYWEARSSLLKSTIRRKSAALARGTGIIFELLDAASRPTDAANIYHAVYANSWKESERHPEFITTLLDKMGSTRTLRLGVAKIGGELAAVQIWLVRPPLATIFKLAHDPKFDRHSPGSLLTYWLLRHFCENEGVTEVDFGRGDDTYKKNWLHSRRYRYGVIAANPRTLSGLSTCLFDVAPTLLSTFLRERLVKAKASS